jgi:hypothetical protein
VENDMSQRLYARGIEEENYLVAFCAEPVKMLLEFFFRTPCRKIKSNQIKLCLYEN